MWIIFSLPKQSLRSENKKSLTGAEYSQEAADGSRPGVFMLIPDIKI
jgi:hypothetical protein